MDIKSEKINLAKIILSVEDENVIQKIRKVLSDEGLLHESTAISNTEKELIDSALSSIENGHTLSSEQIEERRREKFPNLFNR